MSRVLRATRRAAAVLTVVTAWVAWPAAAQNYDWTNDVPRSLEGTWVAEGQDCDDENSRLLIFSDGGYRWRKARTDWGFARGKYSYVHPDAYTVYFRVQRFVQQEQPDFQISVSGPRLSKYSLGSGRVQRYEKCPE